MEVSPKIKLLINLIPHPPPKEDNVSSSLKPELSFQHSHLVPYGTLQFQLQEDPNFWSSDLLGYRLSHVHNCSHIEIIKAKESFKKTQIIIIINNTNNYYNNRKVCFLFVLVWEEPGTSGLSRFSMVKPCGSKPTPLSLRLNFKHHACKGQFSVFSFFPSYGPVF